MYLSIAYKRTLEVSLSPTLRSVFICNV
uniref:Uncharacterized protein n=1 Tax=Anguilla anguilla TaxID=7936 RepID=A0A0E9RNB9_ANGAN